MKRAKLDVFLPDGIVGLEIKLYSSGRTPTSGNSLERLLLQIVIVQKFREALTDIPAGMDISSLEGIIAGIEQEETASGVFEIVHKFQPGGHLHEYLTKAQERQTAAAKQTVALVGLPAKVNKLKQMAKAVANMQNSMAGVATITDELRILQRQFAPAAAAMMSDFDMLSNLRKDVAEAARLLPFMDKFDNFSKSLTGTDTRPTLFTRRIGEKSPNQGVLLRVPPSGYVYQNVSNFANTSGSGITTIWGREQPVISFQKLVEQGHVCQSLGQDDDLESSFATVLASLARVFQRYGIEVHLLTTDLHETIHSKSYQDRVNSKVDELRTRQHELGVDEITAKYRADAGNTRVLTSVMLDLILAEISSRIKNARNLDVRIVLGFCLRSAAYGGYRLIQSEVDVPGNTPITDVIWVGNVDAYSSNELSDTDWNFGTRWVAFAKPGALRLPDGPIDYAHVRCKRRLDNEVLVVRRSTANSPTRSIEEYEDRLYHAMVRPGSRIQSTGMTMGANTMSPSRFEPGTPHEDSDTPEGHNNDPQQNQPDSSNSGGLRKTFKDASRKILGIGKPSRRPVHDQEAELPVLRFLPGTSWPPSGYERQQYQISSRNISHFYVGQSSTLVQPLHALEETSIKSGAAAFVPVISIVLAMISAELECSRGTILFQCVEMLHA